MKTVKPQDFEQDYKYRQAKVQMKKQTKLARGNRKNKHLVWDSNETEHKAGF